MVDSYHIATLFYATIVNVNFAKNIILEIVVLYYMRLEMSIH